ncbi:MAG: MBL fold metallo-hydrolase [FCB group bacterium]|jgi:glyoxylase-like metal-dependent hydrolase (beta-lactamase superfamily II)
MEIITVVSGPVATNCYVLIDDVSSKAVVIDAPLDCTEQIFSRLNDDSIKIEKILLTHSHWDHTAGASDLRKISNADIYIHPDDDYRLKDQNKHSVFPLGFNIEPINNAVLLSNYEKIPVGDIELEVRHTPGHTEGSVCFIDYKNKVVFSGDTLFFRSIGRADLPGGDYKAILNSIRNELMTLSDDFKVFTGHGAITDIGFERRNNPFLIDNMM